jgi:signal transduction histidine kinase/DNA-binding NarL/FixJ family response regulator
MKRSFPVFLLYFCIARTGFSQFKTIELDAPVITPADNLVYLEKQVNLDLVSRQELVREFLRNRHDFVPLEELRVDPEKDESAYWVLFSVQNGTEDEKLYFAEFGKGYFWKANCFVLDERGGLLLEDSYSVLSGRFDRDRLLPRVSFPFSVPPGEQRYLLFRLKAYDIARVPLRLVAMQHHVNSTFAAHIVIGIIFGILGSLLIYNTALFFSIRERWLFYLICTVVSAAIYVVVSANIVPLFYDAPSVFGVLTLIGILLFTRAFLRTPKRLPLVNLLLIIHIAVLPLGIILHIFEGFSFLDTFHSITVISAMGSMFAAGVIAAVRGERQAWGFIAAFVLFCGGVVTSQLNQFGVRYGGATFFLSRAEQPGFAVSLLLLSIAVSNKIKKLREEKIRAEKSSEQLKSEHKERIDFFTGVSHELRTPLANLKLPLERIMRGEEGDAVSPHNPLFEQMYRQTKRLNRHIDNMLTISKLELLPGELKKELTDVGRLCRDCAADFRSAARQKGLELRYEGQTELAVYADVDRKLMESVLLNLLDNAVKYTREGSITLSVSVSDKTVRIDVRDTGAGIPPDDVEKVFTRYYSAGRNGGFGIGLALVNNIVRLHGGNVDIQSTPGKGTAVAVELPAAEGGPVRREVSSAPVNVIPKSIAAYTETEPASGSSILLVEDDPDMLASLSRLLRPHFHVTTAENGEEGLLRLAETKPKLIISDVMMPGMDGFAFIREVRSREETTAVPVIFLTALYSHEEMLEGLQYGAVDYIRKPFDRDVFLEKIRSLLATQSRIIDDYNRRFREYLGKWDPSEGGGNAGSNRQPAADLTRLTPKQREVLELVVKGYTNKEIAELLEVSKKTVDNHVSTVLKKMGVTRRTQLPFEMLQEE